MITIDGDPLDAQSLEELFEPTVEVPAALLLAAGVCCCGGLCAHSRPLRGCC